MHVMEVANMVSDVSQSSGHTFLSNFVHSLVQPADELNLENASAATVVQNAVMLNQRAAMFNPRAVVLVGIILISMNFFAWWTTTHRSPGFVSQPDIVPPIETWRFNGTWDFERDAANLILNSHQCERAFPGLFEEVERPVKNRETSHIAASELDGVPKRNGYVRAMIFNQQVCMYLQ